MADDETDAHIRRELSRLGSSAASMITLASAGEVRRRAGRRRQVVVVAATATAVLVTGAGATVVTSWPTADGGPAGPGDSPSASATSTTTAATTAPTTRPIDPSESETSTPTDTGGLLGSGAVEIPDGYLLPHEGETDWVTDDTLGVPWSWTVCGSDWYERDRRRTDFRVVSTSGIESARSEALAVWGDASYAVDLMSEMQAAIQACTADRSESGFTTTWELRELEVGGSGFVAVSTSTSPEGDPASGGDVVAVVRVGNAVFAQYSYSDGQPTIDGALSSGLESELAEIAATMCVFTVDGC